MLKEITKLWEKEEPDLPWEKGEFNESNTLLLDDSPYKALMNPVSSLVLFSLQKALVSSDISYFLLFCQFIYEIYFQRHSAIFPYSYRYYHTRDSELGGTIFFCSPSSPFSDPRISLQITNALSILMWNSS